MDVLWDETSSCMHGLRFVFVLYCGVDSNPFQLSCPQLTCLFHHFCRPLGLSTQEYGKKWPGLSNERTLNIQSSPNTKTVAQFMDTLRSRLSLHPIQIIGMRHTMGL